MSHEGTARRLELSQKELIADCQTHKGRKLSSN